MRRAVLIACAFVLVAVAVPSTFGQASVAPASTANAASLPATAFEVATIKPSNMPPGSSAWGMQAGNIYRTKNAELSLVILSAYFSGGSIPPDWLKSAPSWVMTDRYDITAKVDDATADAWKGLNQAQRTERVAPLLRKMLEERCKLVVHTVPAEVQGYALVVGKHGAKLKEAQPDGALPEEIRKRLANSTGFLSDLLKGGKWVTPMPGDKTTPIFFQVTMAELAAHFSGWDIRVVDQTGLPGRYDFYLPHWDPALLNAGQPGNPVQLEPIDYLRLWKLEDIGLELKPTKVTVQQLVIDHIERPSAN